MVPDNQGENRLTEEPVGQTRDDPPFVSSVMPRRRWLLGHLHLLRGDLLQRLVELPVAYGDLVPLRFGPYRILLCSHPDFVESVLVTQADCFEKPARFLRRIRPMFGQGVFASQGTQWSRQRVAWRKILDQVDLEQHAQLLVEICNRYLAGGDDLLARPQQQLQDLILELRMRSTLGASASACPGLPAAVSTFMQFYESSLRTWLPLWWPTRAHRRMHAALHDWRQALHHLISHPAPNSDCLLAALQSWRDPVTGAPMGPRELRDQVATWLLTGTETIANSLIWCCWLLGQNPAVQARLAATLQRQFPGGLTKRTELTRVPELAHVVRETLRIYPQAYVIGRKAISSFELAGVRYPAGSTVILNQWFMARDGRWFDNAQAFMPERWAGREADSGSHGASSPYGVGARACQGRMLASLELPWLLARIVQAYHIDIRPGSEPRPVAALTLRPQFADGDLILRRRQPAIPLDSPVVR